MLEVGEGHTSARQQQLEHSPDDQRHIAHVMQRELTEHQIKTLPEEWVALDVIERRPPAGIPRASEHLGSRLDHAGCDVGDQCRPDVGGQSAG